MNIIIISSSVRVGQLTLRVAKGIQNNLMGREAVVPTLIDLAEYEVPPLEYVFKKHPAPPADVVTLGNLLNRADGMIFVSPEYNGSYSSVLKNLVDYFPKETFAKKPIGVASVSSGGGGGMRGAIQLQQLVLALWAYPIPQMLLVPRIKEKFGDDGSLLDENFLPKMNLFTKDFLWFCRAIVSQKQATLRAEHL